MDAEARSIILADCSAQTEERCDISAHTWTDREVEPRILEQALMSAGRRSVHTRPHASHVFAAVL
jgi:hypothetical protein